MGLRKQDSQRYFVTVFDFSSRLATAYTSCRCCRRRQKSLLILLKINTCIFNKIISQSGREPNTCLKFCQKAFARIHCIHAGGYLVTSTGAACGPAGSQRTGAGVYPGRFSGPGHAACRGHGAVAHGEGRHAAARGAGAV